MSRNFFIKFNYNSEHLAKLYLRTEANEKDKLPRYIFTFLSLQTARVKWRSTYSIIGAVEYYVTSVVCKKWYLECAVVGCIFLLASIIHCDEVAFFKYIEQVWSVKTKFMFQNPLFCIFALILYIFILKNLIFYLLLNKKSSFWLRLIRKYIFQRGISFQSKTVNCLSRRRAHVFPMFLSYQMSLQMYLIFLLILPLCVCHYPYYYQ